MTSAALWVTPGGTPVLGDYAASRGWRITAVYAAEPGTLEHVLSDARDSAWDMLVVESLDMIAPKGGTAALALIRDLRESGVLLVSAAEPWLAPSACCQDALAGFAEWEAAQRARLIRDGIGRRRSAGKPVGGRPQGAKDRQPRRLTSGA